MAQYLAPPGRYGSQAQARPGSLVMAGGVVALVLTGIVFAAPEIGGVLPPHGPITIYTVPEPTEPPPPEPAPQSRADLRTKPRPVLDQSKRVIETAPPSGAQPPAGETAADPPASGDGSGGTGTGPAIAIDPPVAPPVYVEPVPDPRYRDALQPNYPTEDRRLGTEGVVVVRVLIGSNGRVLQVERVSAPSDAMFEATRRQALARWRFRPGTRDGTPIERWRVMRVSFHLTDD